MAERPVGVTDQASAAGVAEVRTRERVVSGNTVAEQYVIPIPDRVPSYKGMATTTRILGRAATTQNLFSIFNTTGSAVLVAVRRLSIQMDATAALAVVAKTVKTSRQTTAPTNGTAATKVPFDSAQSSAANVQILHDGASTDGGNAATTVTATAGSIGWSQLVMRLHTAVGQVLMDDEACIPMLAEDDPVILRASEGLLVHIVAAATTSNPASDHHIINCMWEEFTT